MSSISALYQSRKKEFNLSSFLVKMTSCVFFWRRGGKKAGKTTTVFPQNAWTSMITGTNLSHGPSTTLIDSRIALIYSKNNKLFTALLHIRKRMHFRDVWFHPEAYYFRTTVQPVVCYSLHNNLVILGIFARKECDVPLFLFAAYCLVFCLQGLSKDKIFILSLLIIFPIYTAN